MNWVLMIDDQRDFKIVKIPEIYDCCEKVLVRTHDEFIKIINERGLPLAVFFDHDLGPKSMDEGSRCEYKGFNYRNLHGEKTGIDAAKFLINYCLKNNKKIPKYYSHSMNPVGRQNILQLLNKFKERE